MQFSLASIVITFVAGLLLTPLEPVDAQEEPKPSPNPAVFKAQLIEFTQLARKNLNEIQALPDDDSSPLDPGVLARAKQNYILIRAAYHGITLAMQRQTYEDPMLALASRRLDEARELARVPVDFRGTSRHEYISTSVQSLSRSLKIVHQALLILP